MLCSFLCVVFFFTLLISSLPYCSFLHATLLLSFSRHIVAFLFVLHYYFPFCAITLLFALHYCYFHCVALLLSFSHYCSPFCVMLLLSSLHRAIAFLFTLLFSSSSYLAFLSCSCFHFRLFFYFRYKVLHTTTIGVLLFIEESCITFMHSFLQELWVVGSQEKQICIFPFAYFHFLFFYLMSFVFLFLFFKFLGFWFVVQGLL